jgi:hypothetical protein
MLEKAEIIRCRRQEQVINRQFRLIDHTPCLLRGDDEETLSEMEDRVYALQQIHWWEMYLRRRDSRVMHAIP